jgi:hypothetical protein
MNIDNHQCSSCGQPRCCKTIHRIYQRQQEELAALLAQPEPDRERIAFQMFLIYATSRRFPGLKEMSA